MNILNVILILTKYVFGPWLTVYYTTSIALILKIRHELENEDFKLDHDTIKVHFTSLFIKLLTHKLTVSFWKSTKIGQKQSIESIKKLYNLKCAITDLWCVSLLLLITDSFNGNTVSILMEMALIEIFCFHIMWIKCEKMSSFSLVIFIIRSHCNIKHF